MRTPGSGSRSEIRAPETGSVTGKNVNECSPCGGMSGSEQQWIAGPGFASIV
jgi:hypothetical protein